MLILQPVADHQTNDVIELYSVPILGGASVKLSAELTGGGGVVSGRSNWLQASRSIVCGRRR